MKKILILTMAVLAAFLMAACSNSVSKEENENIQSEVQSSDEEKEDTKETQDDESKENETIENSEQSETKEESSSTKKPQLSENTVATSKPSAVTKPAEKEPSENKKPETEAAPDAEEIPQEKPQEPAPEEESNESVAKSLLKQFKNIAASSDALTTAQKLLENPVIAFSGAATSVEEGYLMGFDSEISGFSEGAMFSPMIGTIPFVGYVFTLEKDADTSSFISGLKGSANLRWNICTAAEEMVVEAVGNKVFFVMSPKTFEE